MGDPVRTLIGGVGTRGKHWGRLVCEESDVTGQPVLMRDFYERHSLPEEWR